MEGGHWSAPGAAAEPKPGGELIAMGGPVRRSNAIGNRGGGMVTSL